MGIFKKIGSLFSGAGSSAGSGEAYWITVKCNRCGEVIRTRINLNNDLSADYGESGVTSYHCRKQLIGQGTGELPCFQRIEVELTFDANKRPINREISGGQFVEGD